LNHIIAIRIPHKSLCVFCNPLCQSYLLLRISSIDAFLHDTTPMLVTSYLHTLINHCIIYELVMNRLPRLQYFLNHVVPIYIFSQILHSTLQVFNQQLNLIRLLNSFNYLLNRPSSVSILAQIDRILLNFLNDFSKLLFLACFSYFLSQIVPKWVIHEFHVVLNCVLKYDIVYLISVFLNLLL